MSERISIKDLKPGVFESTFLIANIDSAKTKANKTYMRFTFSDVTGSVVGIDWSPTEKRFALQVGMVVRVKGKYGVDATYGPQIVISCVSDALEEFNESDFALQCPNDMDSIKECFDELLEAIDPVYAEFLRFSLDPRGNKSGEFWTAPAASTLHQAYAGGLAEHSVQVADIAYITSRWCPGLDVTVLIVAGLLHDIGKLIEYEGIGREQTTVSKLIGNTTLSYQAARDLLQIGMLQIKELKFDSRMDNIRHCIIAHHGRREWGSPVVPRTMEAWLIHLADMISARIGGYQRLLREAPEEQEWTMRDLMFDGQLWIPERVKKVSKDFFQENFTFSQNEL